jgi:hypothetical protein
MVLKRLWNKRTVVVAAAAVVAAAVIIALVWPVTDLIAAHDVGVITGASRAVQLQTAREALRTQLLTLGAGVFAAGALVFTARNFTLSRSTFRATEKRVLNERFIAIAAELGHDQAAVRWPGCTLWRGWLMTGRRTGRRALMSCAPTCEYLTSPTRAKSNAM